MTIRKSLFVGLSVTIFLLMATLVSVKPALAVEACGRTISLRQTYGYAQAVTHYNGYGHGHNTGYYNNGQYYDQNVLIVGVPVSNLGLPYYWSVGDDLREERIAQKTAEIIRKSSSGGERGGASGSKGVTRETKKPAQASAPAKKAGVNLFGAPKEDQEENAGEDGGTDEVSIPATDTDKAVLAIFKESCANCHKPGKAIKGIALFTDDGELYHEKSIAKEIKSRFRVYNSVFGGPNVNLMPKNGSPLSNDKVETIRQWLSEVIEAEGDE